jgi:hypothetical protein
LPVAYQALARDLDQDGDVDLIATGRLYQGLARHLAWSSLPRVGHDLALEIHGAPGLGWSLFTADGTVPPSSTPYGLSFLDPGSVAFVASGSLDADGRARSVIPVPNDLGLVGRDLPFQALIGPRLSNLELAFLSGS